MEASLASSVDHPAPPPHSGHGLHSCYHSYFIDALVTDWSSCLASPGRHPRPVAAYDRRGVPVLRRLTAPTVRFTSVGKRPDPCPAARTDVSLRPSHLVGEPKTDPFTPSGSEAPNDLQPARHRQVPAFFNPAMIEKQKGTTEDLLLLSTLNSPSKDYFSILVMKLIVSNC